MDAEFVAKTGSSSLIKNLAASNTVTRNRALKLLKSWLPQQSQISDDNMKKIWKGLFYCVWHADKAPFQAELNERLSSLLLILPRPVSAQYFSIFFLTMQREWMGIDFLRLDKFYLLIRRFLYHCFRFLKSSSWDLELTRQFLGILEERTLLDEGMILSHGVSYHVVTVFLEELKPSLPVRLEVLEVLFLPFWSVMGKSSDKVLLGKLNSNVFNVLLTMGRTLIEAKKSGVEVDASSEVGIFGTIALVMDFSTKFFELGSSTGCVQGNRKILFNLREDFLKLEKDMEASGIAITILEINNNSGKEDVPNSVPIVLGIERGPFFSGVCNENRKKPSKKKRKKAKKAKNGDVSSNTLEKNSEKEIKKATENASVLDGVDFNKEFGSNGNLLVSNASVISNLQKQFEKVAADEGLGKIESCLAEPPKITVIVNGLKKRKRAKSLDGKDLGIMDMVDVERDVSNNSVKSQKKVKFSMKSNLVWMPHSPLPPKSLRLPPSVTPRGSALKKGVPPGPIKETPSSSKKAKIKNGRKSPKSITPSTKRLKKLKCVSV